MKRGLFLHRSQEGFGSHQEPKGQYRRGGFWVWTQETSAGSVCAGDTLILLFCLSCLSFPYNSETSGLFPITDSSPNSQLEAQPTIQREQADPGADKGALFPQLFAGTPLPPSLAPAEQNQMPTCGRRQRAGSIPGPLSRSGLLPETPDAMGSKESPPPTSP